MYLLDTDVTSQFLRGDAQSATFIENQHPSLIYISAVTVEEMLRGRLDLIHAVKQRPDEKKIVQAYDGLLELERQLQKFQIMAYDDRAADIYKKMTRPSLVGKNDMRIAAVAAVNGWTVVTFNRAHFDKIGVDCYDWPADSEA